MNKIKNIKIGDLIKLEPGDETDEKNMSLIVDILTRDEILREDTIVKTTVRMMPEHFIYYKTITNGKIKYYACDTSCDMLFNILA